MKSWIDIIMELEKEIEEERREENERGSIKEIISKV